MIWDCRVWKEAHYGEIGGGVMVVETADSVKGINGGGRWGQILFQGGVWMF